MSINRKAGLFKILLVTVLFLLVGLAVGTAQASEGIKLFASEEKDESGEKVRVSISAENAAGSEGGQFIMNFDPALVKPVAVEPGDLVTEAASGMHMVNREYGEGQLKFMWVTAAADTADEGIICYIEFELLNEGGTALEFEELIISPDEMEPADPVPGRITVGETEVDQQEVEDEIDREEEAVAEEEEEAEDEETAVDAVDDGNNNTVLIVIIVVLAVLGAAGFMFFKKQKKSKH